MRCFAQVRRKLFVEREQTLLMVGIVHGCGLFKCEATAMNCETQRHVFNRAKQTSDICLIEQAHSAIFALFMAVAQPSTIDNCKTTICMPQCESRLHLDVVVGEGCGILRIKSGYPNNQFLEFICSVCELCRRHCLVLDKCSGSISTTFHSWL